MEESKNPIVIIETTPEMDNWMKPQTEERKQRIKEFVKRAQKRLKILKTTKR